jgi:hypothetical protein
MRWLKRRLASWLLKDVEIEELAVRKLRIGENTVTIDANSVTLPGLTADPALATGKVWFRNDLGIVKYSPDGTAVRDLLTDLHRTASPIDHPNGSIIPAKLSFGTWQKITEIDVPANTTVIDVTGLDGDIDKFYIIIFHGQLTAPSGATQNTVLLVKPNATTVTIYAIIHSAYFDGTTTFQDAGAVSISGFPLARGSFNMTGHANGIMILNAKTGYRRMSFALTHSDAPAKAANAMASQYIGAFWSDSTTKITSLRFTVNQGSFDGKLIIYKPSQ